MFKKSTWIPWMIIALLGMIQLQALPGDYLGQELDDAYYVLAARGLLRGEFRLGISPGNPPVTFITPGFPLLLTPAAAVCGESHGCYHLSAWIFLFGCDVLVWFWLKRRLPRTQAILCLILFGLCPLTLARAGKVMTEIPALALTIALFLLLDVPGWPAWGSGMLLAYIWLIRQGTVALLPAVWGWYAVRKRWKDAARSAIPVFAVMLANSFWFSRVGSGTPKLDEMFASYAGGLAEIPRVVAANWSYYAHLWGRLWLPTYTAPGIVEWTVGTVLFSICLLGARLIVEMEGWEPAVAWVFFGTILHTFWPWRYERYLASFLPVLIWTLWEGTKALTLLSPEGRGFDKGQEEKRGFKFTPSFLRGEGWGERKLDVQTIVFIGILILQFYGQSWQVLATSSSRAAPELQETYAWIRANIPAGQALASLPYSRDALYAGHPVAPLPRPAPSEELARILRGGQIAYVLLQDIPDLGSSLNQRFSAVREVNRLREVLAGPPFRQVYANAAEHSVIYQVPSPYPLP